MIKESKEDTLKVGSFFSGIGSPEKALKRLKENGYIKDFTIEFFSEIDKDAIKSYCAIHHENEKKNLGDVTKINGRDLPYCDLWIGGFPCQDISYAGKMKGFDIEKSTRSSLGWEMIRLLKEVENKPKYVIFENVAAITSKKFEKTLKLFKEDLNKLGYTLYDKVLNAVDYGIPQTRKRYFLVAILDKNKKFEFPEPVGCNKILKDFLIKEVPEKYFLTDNKFEEVCNKRIFHKKDRDDIIYEVDMDKFITKNICGADLHSKFNQSIRLFSEKGYAPTLTARNTTDNCKLVVEV